jgi:hypothetical protein
MAEYPTDEDRQIARLTIHRDLVGWMAQTRLQSGLARQLIQKGTILGVVTTTTITKPARELLNQADIAWIDRFPEQLLQSDSRS